MQGRGRGGKSPPVGFERQLQSDLELQERLEHDLEDKKDRFWRHREHLRRPRREYVEINRLFISIQAGIMASALEEGAPVPSAAPCITRRRRCWRRKQSPKAGGRGQEEKGEGGTHTTESKASESQEYGIRSDGQAKLVSALTAKLLEGDASAEERLRGLRRMRRTVEISKNRGNG